MLSQRDVLLDPRIRDWVVFPMIILMIFVRLGRMYVQHLLKSDNSIGTKELTQIRYKQILGRGDRLRLSQENINKDSYYIRQQYYISEETGILNDKKVPGMPNPMSNPNALGDMVKGQITFMLPNFLLMGFVNNFFNGFVCLKVPFSMPSNSFKAMLQRGVDLKELNVSYVSSLSWYLILSFGLNGLYRLILDEEIDLADEAMHMNPALVNNNSNFDVRSAYKQCKDMLLITNNSFVSYSDSMENQLLQE